MGGVVRASAPVIAPEFTYEDDFLPDHAGETYRGLEGLRRARTGYTEPFEEMVYDLERVVGSSHEEGPQTPVDGR